MTLNVIRLSCGSGSVSSVNFDGMANETRNTCSPACSSVTGAVIDIFSDVTGASMGISSDDDTCSSETGAVIGIDFRVLFPPKM